MTWTPGHPYMNPPITRRMKMQSLLQCLEQGCPVQRERIDLEGSNEDGLLSLLHKFCPDHDTHWAYFIVPTGTEDGVMTVRIETNMRTWRGFCSHFQAALVGENSDFGVAANRG